MHNSNDVEELLDRGWLESARHVCGVFSYSHIRNRNGQNVQLVAKGDIMTADASGMSSLCQPRRLDLGTSPLPPPTD